MKGEVLTCSLITTIVTQQVTHRGNTIFLISLVHKIAVCHMSSDAGASPCSSSTYTSTSLQLICLSDLLMKFSEDEKHMFKVTFSVDPCCCDVCYVLVLKRLGI